LKGYFKFTSQSPSKTPEDFGFHISNIEEPLYLPKEIPQTSLQIHIQNPIGIIVKPSYYYQAANFASGPLSRSAQHAIQGG
jgi:hypothetical protein